MEKREIRNMSVHVHPFGVGCWAFGGGTYWGEQSQADIERVVKCALDKGITLFDTAEVYNNGESERSLGMALGSRRKEALIFTKISPPFCRPRLAREHLEASLRRLRTDYIDCYLVHWPFNRRSLMHFTDDPCLLTPMTVAEALGELDCLRKEGMIRAIGLSNFGKTQLLEVLDTHIPISVNEITYNLFSRAIERDILPLCERNNISVLGSMALQQGLLAGRFPNAESVPPAQAHSRHFAAFRGGSQSRHTGDGAESEIFEALARITEIAKELGMTLSQLSIAWVLASTGITSTLVGCRNECQLTENLKSCDFILPNDAKRRLDEITKPVWDKLGDCADYYEDENNSRIF